MFRALCLMALAVIALPAHAADLVTTPPTSRTTVSERHIVLPAPAGIDNSISVEAHDNATINIYQNGTSPTDTTDFGWSVWPVPTLVPTVDELQARCFYSRENALKVVNNITAYSRFERNAFEYWWTDGVFTDPSARDDRRACGILSQRLKTF